MRKPSPFRDGKCFGAAAGIDVCGVQPLVCLLFGTGKARAQAVAELFAALGEAGAHDGEEVGRFDTGGGRLGQNIEAQHGAVDFGPRQEGAGGHTLQDAGSGVELDADCEERHCAGLSDDATGYFVLDEEDGEHRGMGAFQYVPQDGARDVVGEVRYYFEGRGEGRGRLLSDCLGVNGFGGIDLQDVSVDKGYIGLTCELLPEDGNETLVEFDGDDASGPRCQLMGQCAEAGADFKDVIGRREIGRTGDAGEVGRVDEEVLAEGLLEVQIVAAEQVKG